MKRLTTLILLLGTAAGAGAQPAAMPEARVAAIEKMLRGEDGRDAAVIREAMLEGQERRRGIRALGRLEQPELIREVAPALNDGVGIRAEAAWALAQLARTPEATVEVQRLLTERAGVDAELGAWESWGEIGAALGRLPYDSAEQAGAAERVLVQDLPAPDSFNDVETAHLAGAVRGLEALARTLRARKLGTLDGLTWDLLRWAATAQRPAADPRSALTRKLAMAALVSGGQATAAVIDRALIDSDAEVRRLAALAAGMDGALAGRDALIARAMADKVARVRVEGLRAYGRHLQKASCGPVRASVRDPDPHVRLQAIDQLGNGCPASEDAAADLKAVVETLGAQPRTWHAPAHALVALARVSPADARGALPRHAAHATWQVRMYAARAAGVLQQVDVLTALARDNHDNVREAALSALIDAKRPEAVALAIENLVRPDYQLVITATRALADRSAAPRAVPALVTALGRITREKRDTSRDPRMAILDRLQALGDAGQAMHLEGYVKDFDARVAAKAAEILQQWTGTPRTAAPQPLPAPVVTLAAVTALRSRALRFHMAGGGVFDIDLDVDAAPLSALRVARRAGEGYYDGLTFHRVAPNFVIQGGSPGANEYSGDALYMRDEPGLHRRGTVGISTRGHDTGDAQIFVNLVDSPRLDHVYTVFGIVSSGMDVVDGILEGDVIERVEIVNR